MKVIFSSCISEDVRVQEVLDSISDEYLSNWFHFEPFGHFRTINGHCTF